MIRSNLGSLGLADQVFAAKIKLTNRQLIDKLFRLIDKLDFMNMDLDSCPSAGDPFGNQFGSPFGNPFGGLAGGRKVIPSPGSKSAVLGGPGEDYRRVMNTLHMPSNP